MEVSRIVDPLEIRTAMARVVGLSMPRSKTIVLLLLKGCCSTIPLTNTATEIPPTHPAIKSKAPTKKKKGRAIAHNEVKVPFPLCVDVCNRVAKIAELYDCGKYHLTGFGTCHCRGNDIMYVQLRRIRADDAQIGDKILVVDEISS
jgi:hypothetical protein